MMAIAREKGRTTKTTGGVITQPGAYTVERSCEDSIAREQGRFQKAERGHRTAHASALETVQQIRADLRKLHKAGTGQCSFATTTEPLASY